ncbi:hypothetical protein LFM09_08300 [Lentzea alba]|uniref:hypothetical protein n=1 Tax=Lentzea alba TaxID=2714351 RepID=UPI0039BEFA2C
MPLANLEIASLDSLDNPRTRARAAELTRVGGVELQPAETYEASDPSGFIVVTANRARMVVNVRIRSHWIEHIRPEAFTAALYNTYVTAIQRAFTVELARPQAGPPSPLAATYDDPADMSFDEWTAKAEARLNAVDDVRDAVRRAQPTAPHQAITEIRSPLGYLTTRLRAGAPIAITADPHVLRNPSETVLSQEIQQMFVRAGLGIATGERPTPARPRGGGDETDDDYFSAVNVFDDRD